MGEIVAWGLGLCLGYTCQNWLTSRWHILFFVLAILVLGALVTVFSGELTSEPWLIVVDIGQVAVAALIGAFAVPFVLRWLRGGVRSATR